MTPSDTQQTARWDAQLALQVGQNRSEKASYAHAARMARLCSAPLAGGITWGRTGRQGAIPGGEWRTAMSDPPRLVIWANRERRNSYRFYDLGGGAADNTSDCWLKRDCGSGRESH